MTEDQEDAILAKATDVFGSRKDAEIWLERPALAFGLRSPRDVLDDATGVDDVSVLLEQIRYGVYV